MPFFNDEVRRAMNRQNLPAFQEAVTGLEEALAVPIRVVDLGSEGRDRATHATWRGAARELRHYAEGTTEDDFHAKGVTIFTHGWNNNTDDMGDVTPQWRTMQMNLRDICTEGFGQYGPDGNALPLEMEREVFGFDAGEVEGLDCVPIVNSGVHYGDIWDEGRCIFIPPALYEAMVFGHIDWQQMLVEPITNAHDPELLEAARAAAVEKARLAFYAMMEDRGDAAIAEARERATQFAIEEAELREKLVNAAGNKEQYARQLAFLLDQEGDLTDEMVRIEWDGITRNVNVERFTAGKGVVEDQWGGNRQNPWLKVFTKDLFLTNPDNGRKLALGKYEITMNFGDNTVRFKNLTMPQHGGEAVNQRRANTRWDHPHIQEGRLCEREYATAITQLLRDRKLAQMTNMLFAILGTVTLEDNWGRNNIRLWEQADTELRLAKGWPEWTADEEEHPMALELAAQAGDDADNEEGDDA